VREKIVVLKSRIEFFLSFFFEIKDDFFF